KITAKYIISAFWNDRDRPKFGSSFGKHSNWTVKYYADPYYGNCCSNCFRPRSRNDRWRNLGNDHLYPGVYLANKSAGSYLLYESVDFRPSANFSRGGCRLWFLMDEKTCFKAEVNGD